MFNMNAMHKSYIFLILVSLLYGCASLVEHPKIENLIGVWESTGPPSYMQLSVKDETDAFLVIVIDKKSTKLFKLEKFESQEKHFIAKFIDVEGDEKPIEIQGTLILNKLIIKEKSDPKEIAMFIKESDFVELKSTANERIEKYKNN